MPKKEKLSVTEKANKDAILNAMKVAGINSATVSYSGSGDSGDTEDTTFSPEGKEDQITVGIVSNDGKTTVKTLKTAIIDYAMMAVDARHGGWENNDGGHGEITFDAKKGVISIEHNDYVVETVTNGYTL